MLDCRPPAGETYTLPQVILRILRDYEVPVVYGLRSGHVSANNITLPIGVQAELTASGEGVALKILEPATIIR